MLYILCTELEHANYMRHTNEAQTLTSHSKVQYRPHLTCSKMFGEMQGFFVFGGLLEGAFDLESAEVIL